VSIHSGFPREFARDDGAVGARSREGIVGDRNGVDTERLHFGRAFHKESDIRICGRINLKRKIFLHVSPRNS